MANNKSPMPDDLFRKMQELPAAERNGEPGDDLADESRGRMAAKPRAPRLRAAPPVKEGRGRKLTLSDGVYERLEIDARRRKTTMSARANELLDKSLAHFKVTIEEIKRSAPPAPE